MNRMPNHVHMIIKFPATIIQPMKNIIRPVMFSLNGKMQMKIIKLSDE